MRGLEPEVGFEPTTSALQEQRSGQLSYSGDCHSLTAYGSATASFVVSSVDSINLLPN